MKSIKFGFLVLVFVLPVLVYLFLKVFGKNEFEVLPLYSSGVVAPQDCQVQVQGQYYIPQCIMKQIHWSPVNSLTLYYFLDSLNAGTSLFSHIEEEFDPDELRLIGIINGENSLATKIETIQAPADSLALWKRCYFFLKEPDDLLLIDKERRIRGYYQSQIREEMDSLIMESKIILRKY